LKRVHQLFQKQMLLIATLLHVAISMMVTEEVKKAYLEAEPRIDHLGSADFKTTIGSGDHLIFYGASWCGHCQLLTPIWLKVQEAKQQQKLTHINMAKVECTMNQDLCKDIEGYPTIKYYHNGKFEEEYDMTDYEPLLQKVVELNTKLVPTNTAFEKLVKMGKKETEPDEAINPKGEVVYLTDADFYQQISNGPWMVMFHAPWCGHCKTLSPIYTELAPRLSHRVNVGKVDCTVQKKVCNDFLIRGFPTLKFLDGDSKIDYTGERNLEKLETFAMSLVGKPTFEVIKGDAIPGMISKSDSAVFFVFDGDESILPLAVAIATSVKNKLTVYICPESSGYEALGLQPVPSTPTLMISTDNGIQRQHYNGPIVDTIPNRETIKKWILKYKDPLCPQMDTHNQADLTDVDHLLVGMVDPDSQKGKNTIQDLKKIASTWKQENPSSPVKFSWLDGMKYASYINHVYGIQVYSLPKVVITRPRDELYYTSNPDGKEYTIDHVSIVNAIEDVINRKSSV
jgi:protein disulfide-isomerase-like protein